MTISGLSSAARRALAHIGERSYGPPVDPDLRITLNLHPDRDDPPILAALAAGGRYRSQFATGTSNGGLSSHAGGDRWLWESRIFAGAYDETDPDERPVYGALNFRRKSVGAAPRFGSAHFVLTAEAVERATFCYPDSALAPADFGVAGAMDLIGKALADRDADPLDGYIEAQVHGPVLLDRDAEALVLDPSYRDTAVEEAANELPCRVRWHGGFRLTVDEMARRPDYRGPEFVALAREIAVDGHLDPRIIGAAAATGNYDPQSLKRVWHYVACFGPPQSP
jgi:hypothetical protein